MNVVDIHPEELIDKLTAGVLSAAERERLDAHLLQCLACRFEISVRADVEQEAPLFEQRPQLTSAGQHAFERPPLPVNSPAPLGAPMRSRSRDRRRFSLVLFAAAFLLCAGVATAAVVTGAVSAPAWLHLSAASQNGAASKAASTAKLGHDAKLARQTTPAASAPSSRIAEAASEASAEPVPLVAPVLAAPAPALLGERPHPVLTVRSALVPAPAPLVASAPSTAAFAPAPVGPDQAVAPSDAAAPKLDPAASLFADANHARRDGDADRAVALYHDLQTRFPSSSESELSRALLAQMLLERGNPEAALAGFDRYLAQGAPVLGAEALVGRARALEQLGKTEQAVAAWQQVQSRFPGSVHARLAATRLSALGMR